MELVTLDLLLNRSEVIERNLDRLSNRLDDIVSEVMELYKMLQALKESIEFERVKELNLETINLELDQAEIDDGRIN